MSIRAAFFDFGDVILSSPFEAFNAFEARNGEIACERADVDPADALHHLEQVVAFPLA